jgi:hypothetical protein
MLLHIRKRAEYSEAALNLPRKDHLDDLGDRQPYRSKDNFLFT